MKARIILIAAIIGIMMITACGPAASESERTLEGGYDAYFSAVDDAEGFRDLDRCSISKEGFVQALKAVADSTGKEALEDGDADEDDIANMDKTIKAFESDYDEFVDSEDYEPSSLDMSFFDDAATDTDYQFGVGSAKADFQVYLDEKGPFVKFDEAREWISDYMDDLGSFDYFDEIVESALKDKASEMEGCWIEVDEVKREQEQESE